MSPETKLTNEQVKVICDRHDIPYQSHSRITTGFTHEVHRLNDDLILKLYNGEDGRFFETEAALLASRLPFKKPTLIASATKDVIVDRDYIVMSFVPGRSLGSLWHLATEKQRESLIEDICRSLQVINEVSPIDIGLEASEAWLDQISERVKGSCKELLAISTIDDKTAEQIVTFFQHGAHSLEGSTLYPVYWDIHFDNFIVNDSFEFQAIIDLENVGLTALDYPLFVIQKQMDEPEKYLSEDDEKFADRKDYVYLKSYYQKYYPRIFEFKELDTRLKIYQLLDILHLLKDWSHIKELHDKLNALIIQG
jgi:aminoglycoside phosphotransferase